MAEPETLFYDGLVAAYVDRPDYLRREWLTAAVDAALARPGCRVVLIVAEPGAGKTAALAALARERPDWPRYFIRRDSTTPLSGGDSSAFLQRVGHQLAARHPAIFATERLEIVIRQRVGAAEADSEIVGARIQQLRASPFHRTAIQVEQDVGPFSGQLVGLEIAQATVDPRLLEPDVLTNLALIDPLTALAESDPSARVVVLIDALDEVIRFRGSQSILEWLETVAELPANVQFVVTSRPHSRLDRLRGKPAGQVVEVAVGPGLAEVRDDLRSYALRLFAEPAVVATGLIDDPYLAATKVGAAADGNFAYLVAYAKGFSVAAADGNREALAALLRLDALPVGLTGLYAYFLGTIRQDVELLGQLDVDSDDDERTPAWEGVGQRFLSTLAVARAALTLDQLVRFAGVRVYRQDAANVLDRMVPFLDRIDGGWRLFHASLAEFLTDSGGGVEPARWHRRIVRSYRAGAASWADVDWAAVDDYGLLHLAEHLTELDQQRDETTELVNPALRVAARSRFGTDLPFRRIVDVAVAEAARASTVQNALTRTLYLVLVRDGLSYGGGNVPPAVLGLLTRLGRFDEAVARAELLEPGEQQFRSFEAIQACATEAERARLGGHDGVDRLVVAALEVSETESMFRGMERDRCLETAAKLLARYDPERALRLVGSAGADYLNNGDSVRRTAAQHLPPAAALAMLGQVAGARAIAALDLADRLPDIPERAAALRFAAEHLDSEEAPDRIRAIARLAATQPEESDWLAALTALTEQATAPKQPPAGDDEDVDHDSPYRELHALADAAATLRARHPVTARRILSAVSDVPADTLVDYGLKAAARVWADWGEPDQVRGLVDKLLVHYRALGWYGPADDIADLALIVRDTDPALARSLVDEAVGLVGNVSIENDPLEKTRLSSTLSQLTDRLKDWDVDLALRIADRISDGWIGGSAWDSASGRSNTRATIALSLMDDDPGRAGELLDVCLRQADAPMRFGNPDPLVHHGGLFDVIEGAPGSWGAVNFIAYVSNNINYWANGRDYRAFSTPIEVLRSIQLGPADLAVSDSWAGVVAAAVPMVAEQDPDLGHELVSWIVEPAQRLVAIAGLVSGLIQVGDQRAASVLPAIPVAARAIPKYQQQIDLGKLPQGMVLAYLDPGERARAEAALAVREPVPQVSYLLDGLNSAYVRATVDVERLHRSLMQAPTGTYAPEEITAAIEPYAERFDQLQVDLVRSAAAWAAAGRDRAVAEQIIGTIERPWLAAVARIQVLHATADEKTDLATACDGILASLDEQTPASHRAQVVALAVHLIAEADPESAGDLLNREAEALRDDNPLMATIGLAALSWAADPATSESLIRTALAKSTEEANPYVRTAAIKEFLALAVRTEKPEVVAEAVRAVAAGGWTTLMGALVLAVPALMGLTGPAFLTDLDDVIRRAERALNPGEPAPEHIDGVAHPAARGGTDWLPEPPDAGYLELFLDETDLTAMHEVQDSRDNGSDPSDDAFDAYGGIRGGMRIWMDAEDQPVWRLVDVRWIFPDAERAMAYHSARLAINSEGAAPMPDAPPIGDECHVYGGRQEFGIGPTTVGMTTYFYVFRVGSVVVKLFAAQGPQASDELTADVVHGIAERIVARVSRRLPS